MTSLVSLLVLLLLAAVFLALLYVLVAAAVEQGIRRALPDSALRPSFAQQRRQERASERDW